MKILLRLKITWQCSNVRRNFVIGIIRVINSYECEIGWAYSTQENDDTKPHYIVPPVLTETYFVFSPNSSHTGSNT